VLPLERIMEQRSQTGQNCIVGHQKDTGNYYISGKRESMKIHKGKKGGFFFFKEIKSKEDNLKMFSLREKRNNREDRGKGRNRNRKAACGELLGT
jgi:hypothetical protein